MSEFKPLLPNRKESKTRRKHQEDKKVNVVVAGLNLMIAHIIG